MTNRAHKVALVTGASRGIGRIIALQLAQRGVRVALHYRNNREAAAASLASLPGTGHASFDADLSDPREASLLWGRVTDSLGAVDILINNAGLYIFHPPLKTGVRRLAISVAANTRDQSRRSRESIAARRAKHGGTRQPQTADFGRGRIVNISSRGAFRGEPDAPAYAASKAGLNAFRNPWPSPRPDAVYVYCVAPGWVETEMATSHLEGPDGPAILAQHPWARESQRRNRECRRVLCSGCAAAMTGCVIDVNGASYLRT